MFSVRTISAALLPFTAFSGGCRQTLQRSAAPQEPARAVAASASVVAQRFLPQDESRSPSTQQTPQRATHSSAEPELQDVEERKGPFTFGGQTFTVVAHNKRIP